MHDVLKRGERREVLNLESDKNTNKEKGWEENGGMTIDAREDRRCQKSGKNFIAGSEYEMSFEESQVLREEDDPNDARLILHTFLQSKRERKNFPPNHFILTLLTIIPPFIHSILHSLHPSDSSLVLLSNYHPTLWLDLGKRDQWNKITRDDGEMVMRRSRMHSASDDDVKWSGDEFRISFFPLSRVSPFFSQKLKVTGIMSELRRGNMRRIEKDGSMDGIDILSGDDHQEDDSVSLR